MRNQCWTQDGKPIKDDELYLDGKVLKVKDRISGKVRKPTEAETEQFYWEPPRDPLAEIDELRAEIKELKDKIDKE